MTFQKFFDDIWQLKTHHVLLFRESEFDEAWDYMSENEDCLWADIPADPVVAIDTNHTEWKAEYFLSDRWLKAEVTNIIILSGCVCVFLREDGAENE